MFFCHAGIANVDWTLTVTPFLDDKSGICEEAALNDGPGGRFDTNYFLHLGGDAVLEAKARCGNVTERGVFSFKILGAQPSPDKVISFIRERQDSLWFAEYIAQRENDLKQFDEFGYPATSKVGKKVGYGIFQLTDPKPTCEQLWNWMANVKAAIRILQTKVSEARKWMNCNCSEKKCKEGFCVRHPRGGQRLQALHDTGSAAVPERKESNCIFMDSTKRTIEDAVAMKMYNGAMTNYCYWDTSNHVWKFNNTGPYGNYVGSVCNCLEPCCTKCGCNCAVVPWSPWSK